MRVAEHEILDGEFNIDEAAGVALEIEKGLAVRGVRVMDALAHGQHVIFQLRQIARPAQDVGAQGFKTRAQRRVAGAKPRTGQCLVLERPGFFKLVVAEGLDRIDEHARIAVWAQAVIDIE